MAKLYWLGAALILIAVAYQYRKEIQTLALKLSKSEVLLTKSTSKSTAKESPNSNRQEKASRKKKSEQEPPKEQSAKADTKESEKVKEGSTSTASEKYYNPPFDPNNPPEPIYSKTGTRMITLNELAAHGHSGPLRPIWLAVMGRVFDVDKGAENYYGPEGGYKFFTGIIRALVRKTNT